jgi:plasmid stabilization system protein ParE
MKFAVRKLKPAEADALKAAVWYDEQQQGLGSAFLDDLDATIAALAENPLIYSIHFADVHCIRLRRFTSYGLFYMVMGSEVWLLAVHHGARHPRRLRERRQKIQ